MALGPILPPTEMSTRKLTRRKRRPGRKADLTAICEPIVYKMWEPRRLTTLWASTACYRDSVTGIALPFLHFIIIIIIRHPLHTYLIGENG
jgi:hypothetical protein